MSQYAKSDEGIFIPAKQHFEDQFKSAKVECLRGRWYFWKQEGKVLHACSYEFHEESRAPKGIGALNVEDNCCHTCKEPAPDEVNGLAMLMQLHDSR